MAAPVFTVAPSVTAATTGGYTVGFTADSASTVHVVALTKDAATPNAAAVIAHTAALAFATKAVTGADTVTLTGLDFPIHDLYAVLTNAGGNSAVASLLDQTKTAPAGKQYSTFASVDADTVYAAIASPAVGVGDIREIDTLVTPSAAALTPSTDGNDAFDSDGSRQSYVARIYDVSVGNWMATDGAGGHFTVWFNNQPPALLDPDTEIVYTFPVNASITPIDLAALVQDPESDAVTVTALDAEPVGLSTTSNILSGTPTVRGLTDVLYQFEDIAGASFTRTISLVVEGVDVPDVVGMSLGMAIDALLALFLNSAATNVYSASAAGTVIAQSPSPGTQVAYGSQVTLTVSLGRHITGVALSARSVRLTWDPF